MLLWRPVNSSSLYHVVMETNQEFFIASCCYGDQSTALHCIMLLWKLIKSSSLHHVVMETNQEFFIATC